MLHGVEVERYQEVGTTKRAAGVAALATVHHPYYVPAHLRCHLFQIINFHLYP
jgi:hypothetical protein